MLEEIIKEDLHVQFPQSEYAAGFRGFFNDQTCFGLFFSRHPDLVAIDHEKKLSATVDYRDNEIISSIARGDGIKPFAGNIVGSWPCLLHVPTTGMLSYAAFVYTALALIPGVSCLQVDVRRLYSLYRLANRAEASDESKENLTSLQIVWNRLRTTPCFWMGFVASYVRYFSGRLRVHAGSFMRSVSAG